MSQQIQGQNPVQVDDEELAVPPWFGPALVAAGLTGLTADLADLTAGLIDVTRTTCIAYNLGCAAGRARIFKVVPFVNGDNPTAAPYNLPALINSAAITALTSVQANTYLTGYNLPIPPTISQRKNAIMYEIGGAFYY